MVTILDANNSNRTMPKRFDASNLNGIIKGLEMTTKSICRGTHFLYASSFSRSRSCCQLAVGMPARAVPFCGHVAFWLHPKNPGTTNAVWCGDILCAREMCRMNVYVVSMRAYGVDMSVYRVCDARMDLGNTCSLKNFFASTTSSEPLTFAESH